MACQIDRAVEQEVVETVVALQIRRKMSHFRRIGDYAQNR